MDNEYLPEWKPLNVTAEELEKLRAKDRTILEAFYFENYVYLVGIAKQYAWKKRCEGFGDIYSAEELVQDLYIGLPFLSYEKPAFFKHTVFNWFYMVRYGGKLAKPTLSQEQIDGERKLLYIIDEPLHDNDSDSDMKSIDRYCAYHDPYQELFYYKEQLRLNKLEEDLEHFLKELFTKKQFEKWQAGKNTPDIQLKLQKNADAVIAFLRSHGTSERELHRERLPVIFQNDPERKSRAKARKELWEWQITHLDELDEATRLLVERRLRDRAYGKARREREKARASV